MFAKKILRVLLLSPIAWPLKLTDEGDVLLPEGLKKTMKVFFDGGWHRMELPEHLGGYGIPRSAYWGAYELMVGSNPAATFYLFGNFVAMAIDGMGTEEQKKRYVQPILDRRWGGTMVLTEPGAGSDVGAGRSKARHIEGDLYELEGVKRFITNGDFDGVENIVHLVLARPEGAGVGTKGLSLFGGAEILGERRWLLRRTQWGGLHQYRKEDGTQRFGYL